MMVSQPIMTMQKAAAETMGLGLKGSALHRTHYTAPSGGGYHQHHHVYHLAEPEVYHHGHSDHGGGGSKKKSIALSALTLLAFLFFLNILQNCIQDQIDDMNQQQIIVMTSRLQQLKEAQKRTADEKISLTNVNNDKIDSERHFEKFQRKVDTITRPNNLSNVTIIKVNTKNKNRNKMP